MSEVRSIFSQLKSEHDEVKDLFEKAVKASPHQRQALVDQIKEELIPHARGEEKTLYAALLDSGASEKLTDLVKEAYEEHEATDKLFAQLDELSTTDEMWKAKLTVIKENVEHHIKEEENDLFPAAQKYIDASLSKEILSAYEKERDAFAKNLPTQKQIKSKDVSSLLSPHPISA